jgi:antagonist of KipI
MKIKVIKPGMLTTFQDLGRYGYQNQGVIVSGAMDNFALRLANLLVGNPEHEAGIEITLFGPELLFEENECIALCGGGLSALLNEELIPLWQAVHVKKGSYLSFKRAEEGCRLYLAVAGGFPIVKILGSKSTYLRAGFGGYQGRMLKAGDVLQREPGNKSGSVNSLKPFSSSLLKDLLSDYAGRFMLRVMKGPEFDRFDEKSQKELFRSSFKISSQSDRMGYRLEGIELRQTSPVELISTAVTRGTLQVLPDGRAILLMADCQTIGGYPRIAQLASVDQSLAAQLKPGDSITFKEISLNEAEDLLLAREKKIEAFKKELL